MKVSKIFLAIAMLVMLWDTTLNNPKWDLESGRSTINFDVSAYYMYLPAIFIHQDIKALKWKDEMMEEYKPTNTFHQAFKHSSGNYVMKHTIGQAILYSPFFALGHLYALASPRHKADGFSIPYQFAIFYGSLLVAFFGLWMMRKVLLLFFSEWVTAILLFSLVFGTNWYPYSTSSGAMTHNYLFGIYATLIWATAQFYREPTYRRSIVIGLLCGLATLVRPTELLSVLIPLLYAGSLKGKSYLSYKLDFFSRHLAKVFLAMFVCFCTVAIQTIYWKYATGDWIVYSYGGQGFSFLSPHFLPFNFSYKTGWLVYTPIIWFALIGFIVLFLKNTKLFIVCFSFFMVFWYLAFSWDVWDYGGTVSQRAMVQSYPILLLPLGYFVQFILSHKKWVQAVIGMVLLLFSYYNWWQSHSNGVLKVGQMTKAYFWKTVISFEENEDDLKLLDATEEFDGSRKNIREIYFDDFEEESNSSQTGHSISGRCSAELIGKDAKFGPLEVDLENYNSDWIRVSADFESSKHQRLVWKHTQLQVELYEGKQIARRQKIRVSRFLFSKFPKNLFLDVRCDDFKADKVVVRVSNLSNDCTIWVDNLRIETFDE